MAKKCFYELFTRIEDKSNLASIFNLVLGKLDIVRMTSAPTTFEKGLRDVRGIELFYESCLWELYLHGVVDKLNRWKNVLDEYKTEFESSWKYYASSKRIESINEYGGEDGDYNEDGNIRTLNLTDKDLEYYTVIRDLVQDDWRDIVQETKPEHLSGLYSALQTQAKISITDIFKDVSGKELNMYKQDVNGEMVKMNIADRALSKASDELKAEDLSNTVLFVCHCIQFLIEKIEKLDKFNNNQAELSSINRDIECLLSTNFMGMDIFNEITKQNL